MNKMTMKAAMITIVIAGIMMWSGTAEAQQFKVNLDGRDSLYIKQLKQYKKAVKVISKNQNVFPRKPFMLDKNGVDSLVALNSSFRKVQKLYDKELVRKGRPSIEIVRWEEQFHVTFYTRLRTQEVYPGIDKLYCTISYTEGKASPSHWGEGTEMKKFPLKSHWEYIVKIAGQNAKEE